MNRSEIRNLVIATLASHLNVTEQRVTENASLRDDLGADSLDYVELVLEFEEMFQVDIPDDDLEQCETVGNFINLIDTKVSKNMTNEREGQSAAPRPTKNPGESEDAYEKRVQAWEQSQKGSGSGSGQSDTDREED